MPSIHFDIEPFNCLVRQQYLYDFKSGFDKFLPCKVFAVSSYPGHLLTFQILVEDKYLFSYIPVHALASKETDYCNDEEASAYFNCPSEELTVHIFPVLRKSPCTVFDKKGKLIGSAKYMMTFDWHNDNQLCHLLSIGSQFMLWPSHKLIFDDVRDNVEELKLPDFKKLHKEWVIK